MTEDELDLLASAYLDGEATSEEVAMVERDPQLLARVEELRTVSEQVGTPVSGPSAELKEQQLAAALSAFASASGTEADSGDVVDLTSRSRAGRSGGAKFSKPRQDAQVAGLPRRSIPSWLPAAAALLLLGGGGAWLFSQADGFGGDDLETASFDTDAGTDEAEDGAARSVQAAESSANAEMTESEEEEAMEDESAADAMEEDADTAADGADDSGGTDEESATAAAPAEDGEESADGDDGEGGLFPEEPVLSFAAVPSAGELPEDLPELRANLNTSLCGATVTVPDGQMIVGYLPIEIGTELAELFILVDDAGEQKVAVTSSSSCEPIQ